MLAGSGDRARSSSRDSNRSTRSRSPGMPGAEKRKPTPPPGCPDGACYNFYTTGTCKFTDCKFKHVAGPSAAAVVSEPSAAAAGRSPGRPASATKPKPATDKSKPCPHWTKGSCKFGDKCAWRHSGPAGAAAPAAEELVFPRKGESASEVGVDAPPALEDSSHIDTSSRTERDRRSRLEEAAAPAYRRRYSAGHTPRPRGSRSYSRSPSGGSRRKSRSPSRDSNGKPKYWFKPDGNRWTSSPGGTARRYKSRSTSRDRGDGAHRSLRLSSRSPGGTKYSRGSSRGYSSSPRPSGGRYTGDKGRSRRSSLSSRRDYDSY